MRPDSLKIKSLVQLFEILPENERITVDVLRQIILENLPGYCKEKISYNVFYDIKKLFDYLFFSAYAHFLT